MDTRGISERGPGTTTGVRSFVVAVGGSLGAMGRWGLDELVPVVDWPAATLVANLLGTLVLALVTRQLGDGVVAVGFRVGLLGAFTTWSALVVGAVALSDRPWVAMVYVVASLGGGVAVAAWGLRRSGPVGSGHRGADAPGSAGGRR